MGPLLADRRFVTSRAGNPLGKLDILRLIFSRFPPCFYRQEVEQSDIGGCCETSLGGQCLDGQSIQEMLLCVLLFIERKGDHRRDEEVGQ